MKRHPIRPIAARRRTFPVRLAALALPLLIFAVAGCSGSGGGSVGDNTSTPSEIQPGGGTNPRTTPEFPPGKFTVQLGAFQSEDGAQKIAALTRSRFTKDVYTVFNDTDGLYKVMLGIFDTKDEARAFRDTIVRQFPDDYMDAWVSDLAK